MTTRTLTGLVVACAMALSLGSIAPAALAQQADTVTIQESQAAMPCPVPDVLADHEMAVGCSVDVATFLKRLKSDTACGSQTSYSVDDACAVIIYSLDPQFMGELKLPPTVTVRIGQIAGNTLSDTYVTLIKSNGVEERLGPDRLYELLIPIRLDERVIQHRDAGLGRRPEQKIGLYAQGIRYYPALMVGRGEASRVMTREATKKHFTMPVQIVQNLDKLLSTECLVNKRCT